MIRDAKAFGRQHLQADVVGARRDRALDHAFEAVHERLEQPVLRRDPEREAAVQERGDRRQVLPERAVPVGEVEAGHLLEETERAPGDPAGMEVGVEAPERRAGIGTLQVVVGAEHPLPARLALAAGDRAERVEAARDRREEPLLALHVRRDGPEQRRLPLVRPVGPPEPLDRGVGLPARLEEIVDPEALVPRAEVGVVASPRAARVREDEDALLVVLERLGLGEVGGGRPVLEREALDAALTPPALRSGAGGP